MGMVGGYSLHLYCDFANEKHRWDEFPHEYSGETAAECKRQSRADGWLLKAGVATCPKCRNVSRKSLLPQAERVG
jgi:hypothetical protein